MLNKNLINHAVFLLFFAFSTTALASNYKGKLPLISSAELLNQKANYIVLDTRTVEEFNHSHIEGAINIPHTEVASELDKFKGLNKTIVVHCRSGRRALVAEKALLDAGFTNIKHLEGDMKGWLAEGLPTVSNDE